MGLLRCAWRGEGSSAIASIHDESTHGTEGRGTTEGAQCSRGRLFGSGVRHAWRLFVCVRQLILSLISRYVSHWRTPKTEVQLRMQASMTVLNPILTLQSTVVVSSGFGELEHHVSDGKQRWQKGERAYRNIEEDEDTDEDLVAMEVSSQSLADCLPAGGEAAEGQWGVGEVPERWDDSDAEEEMAA